MSRAEIEKALEAHGIVDHDGISYDIFFCMTSTAPRLEGPLGGRYMTPHACCIAKKLFGLKIKFTVIKRYINANNVTPFIVYDPRRSKSNS